MLQLNDTLAMLMMRYLDTVSLGMNYRVDILAANLFTNCPIK